MNSITYNTLEDETVELNIPTDLTEINFGQLLDLETGGLSNCEALSILTGQSLEQLYNVKNIESLQGEIEHYIDVFKYTTAHYNLDILPKHVVVSYRGKKTKVKLRLDRGIRPIGAFLAINSIIKNEIDRHIEMYGEDHWMSLFNPSLEACGRVIDIYLGYPVTGKILAEPDNPKLSNDMKAADVLGLAKYFFNHYSASVYIKAK